MTTTVKIPKDKYETARKLLFVAIQNLSSDDPNVIDQEGVKQMVSQARELISAVE